MRNTYKHEQPRKYKHMGKNSTFTPYVYFKLATD